MGYELHLVRRGRDGKRIAITLDEWLAAVQSTPLVRLMKRDWGNGQITLPANSGDVEVRVGRIWQPVLRCTALPTGARITTKPAALGEPAILAAMATLARALGLTLEGDEGEGYDLETGAPMPID